MHTGQILLVEAETASDALDFVNSQINGEDPYPTWSDWCEVGGRWSGLFREWGDADNVMAYMDNPTLAEELITEFTGYRLANIQRYKEELDKDGFTIEKALADYDMVDDEKRFANGMNLWRLQKLSQLLQEDWTNDSGVFDLKEGTGSLAYFRNRLAESPLNQYLVVVDFHY